MRAQLINALLQKVAEVGTSPGVAAAHPGRPFARFAPTTPHAWTATATLRLGDDRVECLLSVPEAVLDDLLIHPARPTVERRRVVLVSWLERAIARACDEIPSAQLSSPVSVVEGVDVVLPWLSEAGRRICVPWRGPAGAYVVETALINCRQSK